MALKTRDETLASVRERPAVSILIIGGGVNGLGLLRELAFQGVDCLLVDRADFASGATSKSSRMIHGGLRYLENREIRLVRESLRERNLLLDNAPHVVTPLETVIPLFSRFGGLIRSPLLFLGYPSRPGGRGRAIVRLGLWFYDFVTRKDRRTPRHFFRSREEALGAVPGLNPAIVGAATYWDARISQAERLCIELLQDSLADNATCRALNYVSVEGISSGDVVLRDRIAGATFPITARLVVNVTGAWVDRTNEALGLATRFMGGTKGSHLVVANAALAQALGNRMVYYEHADGRVCIAFVFGGKVILGSTDIPVSDPDAARCDEAETEYILTTIKGIFPGAAVSRDDVVYRFCGVRPLPAGAAAVPGRITRDRRIEVAPPAGARPFPVISVIGGKWTTFRALGEEVADAALELIGARRWVSTEETPIGGGKGFPVDRGAWIEAAATASGLSPERIATLFDRYGTSSARFAARAGCRPERPLATLPGYTVEEIEAIVAGEYVVHLADLVERRSVIALLGDARREVLEELASIAGERLGWDEGRRENEVGAALGAVRV